MKTVSLDLHDLSLENNNMYFIDKLREQYPNFKVSMFYIPVDSLYFNRLMPEMKEVAKELIRNAVNEGWMELIPHGLTHIFGEFARITYSDMTLMMDAYKEHFEDLGVPYVKGFCAPNWLISQDAVNALDDYGWWLAVDRNQPDSSKTRDYYEYNWDIADPFPNDRDKVKGHGHISGPSKNDFTQCFMNLTRIPPDYKWVFASEMLSKRYGKRNRKKK